MNNKNTLKFTLILCLAVVAYYLLNQDNAVSRTDRRDFSVADTSQVVKVILTSKMPEVATIERKSENEWLVNETYKARKSAIYYLLKTLQRMEIAHPVPLTMRDNVLGNLAVRGIKVQVFLKNGEEKTFYVGGENQELSATFMMLQDATDPYAVHIPGFKGYLSSRFFTEEFNWRDKSVMNIDNKNIASIHMQYHDVNKKDESFHIEFSNNEYVLSTLDQSTPINSSELKIQQYLGSFRKLYAEGFISGHLNVDSMLSAKPIFDLTVKTKDLKEKHITVYHKKAKPGTYIDGDITMRDPERMYAFVDNEDWLLIQTNTFKKVMKKLSDLQN